MPTNRRSRHYLLLIFSHLLFELYPLAHFILAFQFSSMGSTVCIMFLCGKIHLYTTKDDTFKPVNINAIFLNKICWLLVCNIICSQFNMGNATVLRNDVKLHHASPLPCLNTTKYLAKFHQSFHFFKRVWHRRAPLRV